MKNRFLVVEAVGGSWGEGEGLAVERDTQDELAGRQPASQPVVHSVVLHNNTQLEDIKSK